MIGTTRSHFRVVEKLGEGGMGFLLKLKTEYYQLVRSVYIEYNLTLAPDKVARFIFVSLGHTQTLFLVSRRVAFSSLRVKRERNNSKELYFNSLN